MFFLIEVEVVVPLKGVDEVVADIKRFCESGTI